jgi:RNA polymerase sigma-70 factor (ECF subfamily)
MTDTELITMALQGNQSAYTDLYNKYFPIVMRITTRFVSSYAEDLAQETFIKAFTKLGTFKNQSKFSTWLHTIARNECMMFLRKPRIKVELSAIEDVDRLSEYIDRSATNPVLKMMLENGLSSIHNDNRRLIVYKYIYNYTHEELAYMRSETVPNTKTKIVRARKALRNSICTVN